MLDAHDDQLIEKLLAGGLSPEEHEKLMDRVVHDSSVADEVLGQMWLEPLLSDSFQSDPDDFVRQLESEIYGENSDSAEFAERVVSVWERRSSRRSRRRVAGIAIGACVILAVFVAVVFRPDGGAQTIEVAPVAHLQHVLGDVSLVTQDGQPRQAVVGSKLEPGDTIITSGESSATLSWDGGSHVTLTRNASLSWPSATEQGLRLKSGLVRVSQPVREPLAPVVLMTQHATLESHDSDFVLSASDRQTDVSVQRGTVRITHLDGQLVEVSHGENGIAKAESLDVRSGSATPDTWSEDFEAGIPTHWQQGHFIDADLPEGSRGAVGTELSQNEDGDPCHQIWTYSEWEHGLAIVHEDTCLNFVYRFKTPDRVQVMTLLRPEVPDSPTYEVQILSPADVPTGEQWWNIPAQEWYMASIPLSRLSDPVTLDHPTESFIATAFNFRVEDHACGLVIDRMWVTRDSSSSIRFSPLQIR